MVRYTVILLFFCSPVVQAQELVFGEPKVLSSRINSEAEELLPLLSPDGKSLYFVRAGSMENVGGKYSGTDIWMSQYDVTLLDWGKPVNMKGTFNTKGNNAVVGISNSGDVLYLLNTESSRKTKGIHFTKRLNGNWSKPELIPIAGIESESFIGAYVSPDFEVIFLSLKLAGGKGEEDLYVSFKDSKNEWTAPKNLGAAINTAGFEISPFLSKDKRRLYFSSNGRGGSGGADIFYSDRLYNSWETWTTPKNLGDQINSSKFDAYFYMPNDSVAYFASGRSGSSLELYVSKRSIVVSNPVDESSETNFLPDNELIALFGVNFEGRLKYASHETDVLKEKVGQLNQVALVMKKNKEVKLQLVVKKSKVSSLDSNKTRLINILNYLKQNGVDGSRISLGSEVDNSAEELLSEEIFLRFHY